MSHFFTKFGPSILFVVMGFAAFVLIGAAIYLLFVHRKDGAAEKTKNEQLIGKVALLVMAAFAVFMGRNIIVGMNERIGSVIYVIALILGYRLASTKGVRKTIARALYVMVGSLLASALYLMGFGGSHSAVPLKDAQVNMTDYESLQNGARVFGDYCLSCHSLSSVRYNQLLKLKLSEDDIKTKILKRSDSQIGDLMMVSQPRADAAAWFGVPPPDLSLVTSARTADWVYTYLISFYRDDERPTGWNNALFPGVGMPHALWTEEGVKAPKFVEKEDEHTGLKVQHLEGYEMQRQGKAATPADYEKTARDVTNFLAWASEPDQDSRKKLGYGVLIFLVLLFLLARRLNKNYWKDIH